MILKTDLFMKLAGVMFGLLAIFNLAIGTYHTILFTVQGSQSLFSTAYGIPVTAADMRDSARLLGSDAIEMYSILLGGYGALSLWATIEILRGRRFWILAQHLHSRHHADRDSVRVGHSRPTHRA